MTLLRFSAYFFGLSFLLLSCGTYRQNIMFKVSETDGLKLELRQAEMNYTIQKNDLLQLEVYSNRGERVVDPNQERLQHPSAENNDTGFRKYLVDINGVVKFPLINELKVEGLTIRQAEEILQKEYEKFFPESFVLLTYGNKRVVVLGASGGQVIPLTNENMRLTEILALSRAMTNDAKAYNIRVLRADKVLIADLSTFAGYQNNNILIHPNDIVYVEPIRRPLIEGLRDYSPVISIISTLTAIVVVIVGLNQ